MTEISKDSKYVARDKNGELWEYKEKPVKMEVHGFWIRLKGDSKVTETNDVFRNVRWSDDEPSILHTGFDRLDQSLMQGLNQGHAPRNQPPVHPDAVYNLPEDANPKVNKHKEIAQLLTETYRSKNKDYGDAFGKSHEKYGAIAGLTRMSDKFNRIEELILTKEQLVDDESVLDTLLDLANYSIMLYMELEGEE